MISFRRPLTGLAVAALAGGLLTAVSATSATAAVPTSAPPVTTATQANAVRATVLPTAQMNGIAYAQVIVGDTVYVGGTFTKARPAGVAVGGAGEVTRNNLLAYSLSTGKLVDSFAPDVNDTVKVLTASPDGTRLYVGGLFTAIDGVSRYRIAAFDTATGQLISTFKPIPNYVVQAIAATNKTVFFGGKFGNVNGVARSNLAAVQKDTGALTTWAPQADDTVQAMVLSPDNLKVIIAGNLAKLNGTTVNGLGSVKSSDGTTRTFAANQVVKSYGSKAAFLSLSSDGTAVYATAYNFGGSGNMEGTVSANPNTGAINWVEDCHGDTYGAWSDGTTVYTVGHAHFCGNIGGFPQVPTAGDAHRALAFSAAAAGTVQHNTQGGYGDLGGQPAPSLRDWFPDLLSGTVSGSQQAAWTVTGSGKYVVMAGEFPKIGSVAQQGMVRFAKTPISPDTLGPVLNGATWPLTVKTSGSNIALSFPSNWDRDDYTLRYRITRDTGTGTASTVIYAKNIKTLQWNLPTISFTDTGVTGGTTYRYRVSATDSADNVVKTEFVTVTAS